MKSIGALLLAALALALAFLAGHQPTVDHAVNVVHSRTCPSGTFMAVDGFCTHTYVTPPPGTPPAAPPRR